MKQELSRSPLVEISLANNMKIRTILDMGSETNLLAEGVYEELVKSGVDILTLPLENVILVAANIIE
jgi:seryl-tRNA(Sec) selenium transferase